jgi:hypothetical protein
MNMGSYSDKENNKSIKREAAEARQAAYDKLSISDRIAKLDARFGVGQGAVRERAKLQALLANPRSAHKKMPPPPKEEPQVVEQEKTNDAGTHQTTS